MFLRIACLFCYLLLLFSCKDVNRKAEKKSIAIDSLHVYQFIKLKKTDSAFALARAQLNSLKTNGQLKDYIQYNERLADTFNHTENRNPEMVKFFYRNIYQLDGQISTDTALLHSITNAYYQWGEIAWNQDKINDTAISCIGAAISLNNKTPALAPIDHRYAYSMLGITYSILGEYKMSLSYYDLQLRIIDPTNVDRLAANAINRSIALRETGQTDSAIHTIEQVLHLKGIPALKICDLLTTLSIAQMQKGLLKEAVESNTEALSIVDTIAKPAKDVKEKIAMALKQKGSLERLNKKYQDAFRSQSSALRVYKEIGKSDNRDFAKIYIELGKSYAGAQLYDSALFYYQAALHKVMQSVDSANIWSMPKKAYLYAENTFIEALDAKAEVLRQKYRQTSQAKYLETAAACYEMSFDVENKLMQNFSYDESRLLMLKQSRKRSETAIDLCYQLFQLTGNNYWTEKAFLFAEKSKAFVLLESIKRNIATNTMLQNDTLYRHIQSLQVKLTYVDRKISETDNNNDSVVAALNKQRTILDDELVLANNEFKRTNTSYKLVSSEENNISLGITTEKLLNDNTALIEFFAGDSATYIFSFSKNGAPVFFKAENTLTTTLNNFLIFFKDKNRINNGPVAYGNIAFKLYQQLGFEVLGKMGATRLLIIPDGRFNFIPFEALVTAETNPETPKTFPYLFLKNQIDYGYSVATLLEQQENSSTSASGNMVCFAPVFANNERGETYLPYTVDEIGAIRMQKPKGKYFLKGEATFNRFKNVISDANIIHIASHASSDTTAGMQPRIQFYDSSLFLNEIYSMHINPSLVVLSACETGIGVIDKSEGAMSLARGFYYAGAKNVITSLWSVDDRSTAKIFGDFYQHLSGNDYATTLYEAKLNYLENATAANASPYYWAGFVHIGYEKQRPKNHLLLILIACIGLILACSFFLYHGKK